MNIIQNIEEQRFEVVIEEQLSKLEYKLVGDKIYFTHTIVPEQLEGLGIGTQLVEFGLSFVKKYNLQLIPQCPFVAQYIKEHPEYENLLMKGYKIK